MEEAKPEPTPRKKRRPKLEAGFAPPARASDKPLAKVDVAGRPTLVFPLHIHEKVRELAIFGMKQVDICRFVKNPETGMPIDFKTLQRHFREELDHGQQDGDFTIMRTAYQLAVGTPPEKGPDGKEIPGTGKLPDRSMVMFQMKTRPGLRISEARDQSEPEKVQTVDDDIREALAPLTHEQKLALRDILRQRLADSEAGGVVGDETPRLNPPD